MITVLLKYAGLTRTETGKKQECWPTNEGATLGDLLKAVASKYKWALVDRARFIVVYNNRGISSDQWNEQLLDDNDQVVIISSISGG